MPDAAETVTFMFTDIEGSTRLLQERPSEYPSLVQTQRRIIGGSVESHRGRVIGYEGDSVFAAFEDASSAVTAAGEAQRNLLADERFGTDILVRIGLHTGVAERSGDGYFGLAVHTASRVAAAAHGGQILLTDATHAAARGHDLGTRDMGLFRLRDIEEPVRLHQLVGGGLRDEHRLPNAMLNTPPGPTSSTPVGRRREIDELRGLLEHARMVTLVGPGGVGKTTLATAVGAAVHHRLRDGVWFADLTRTADSEMVAAVIAESLGVSVRANASVVSSIVETISGKELLLIVDNFEHVVDAAPVVAQIVDTVPSVRVLVTSREQMRLTGEVIFPVDPLEVGRDSPAVRLFVERTRAVRPDFEPTTEEEAAIESICARLDGLPLAIELAAARMRLLQPDEIERRLANDITALKGGPRDLHERQRTIRSTIEWSFELLTPEERALFVRLSLFSSPVRLEVVESVLDDVIGGDLEEALSGLLDKSMVHHVTGSENEPRTRMLELIREFAVKELRCLPDHDSLRARHARHYAGWVVRCALEVLRVRPDVWVRRIDAEIADVTSAFEWSVERSPTDAVRIFGAMGHVFHRNGMLRLARQWLEAVRSIEVPAELEVSRSMAAGFVCFGFRELPEARVAWTRSLEAARRVGDDLAEAWALMNIGASYIGDASAYREALELIRTGTQMASTLEAPTLVGLGYNVEGEVARVHGDDDTALAAYLAGIDLARQAEDLLRDAILHGNRVYIATHRGRYEEAVELAAYAMDIHRRHGQRDHLAWVSIALSGALAQMGRTEDATILLAAAEGSAARLGWVEGPGDRAENELIRATVVRLAGDRYGAWQRQGRSMRLDEAIDLVLGA